MVIFFHRHLFALWELQYQFILFSCYFHGLTRGLMELREIFSKVIPGSKSGIFFQTDWGSLFKNQSETLSKLPPMCPRREFHIGRFPCSSQINRLARIWFCCGFVCAPALKLEPSRNFHSPWAVHTTQIFTVQFHLAMITLYLNQNIEEIYLGLICFASGSSCIYCCTTKIFDSQL